MAEFLELEYRGLNIMDEISTVEIAIDSLGKTIHVFDTKQVVEPEFNFSEKSFQMSEGFHKMAEVLYGKGFQDSGDQTIEEWKKSVAWIFYGSRKSILKAENNKIIEMTKAHLVTSPLFEKYAKRVNVPLQVERF